MYFDSKLSGKCCFGRSGPDCEAWLGSVDGWMSQRRSAAFVLSFLRSSISKHHFPCTNGKATLGGTWVALSSQEPLDNRNIFLASLDYGKPGGLGLRFNPVISMCLLFPAPLCHLGKAGKQGPSSGKHRAGFPFAAWCFLCLSSTSLCCHEAEAGIIKLPFSQESVAVSVPQRPGCGRLPGTHGSLLMEGVKSTREESGVAAGGGVWVSVILGSTGTAGCCRRGVSGPPRPSFPSFKLLEGSGCG